MRSNFSTYISVATHKNWEKLKYTNESRLTSRANKTQSLKRILPIEYFSNKKNIKQVVNLLEYIDTQQWEIGAIIYSLGINLLTQSKIISQPHVQQVINSYTYVVIKPLLDYKLPNNEKDLLGLIYQCLLTEGEKNRIGSYYTPHHIATSMTQKLSFASNQLFLDPCCGSGAFLLSLKNIQPQQIYGVDLDPIAVMAAKINLLLKYPEHEFIPQIFCFDYLENNNIKLKFDYIISNPPWGAIYSLKVQTSLKISSKETFSHFFISAYEQLKDNGIIRFLVPESILRIKKHQDIRSFLLKKSRITGITLYDINSFTNVYTKYVDIQCTKDQPAYRIPLYHKNCSKTIDLTAFKDDNVSTVPFSFMEKTHTDTEIIEQISQAQVYNLSDSKWALGIVTGNNKQILKDNPGEGLEPIYTGKEISPYILKPVRKYIHYDRTKFQQVAKDELYRAPEKLVYKFISKKLVFAYDNQKHLFLNSANILIPHIPNMSIKTVLAFLNSDLFQYLYKTEFKDIKILKSNLLKLPFPRIHETQNTQISQLVDLLLDKTNNNLKYHLLIQDEIYHIFKINKHQINHIQNVLYGTSSKRTKTENSTNA